jgi:hypothetical protein
MTTRPALQARLNALLPVLLVANVALLVGCAGGGANPNSPSPAASAVVNAPPPPGVSANVWLVAFASSDNRLHRPIDAVHIVLPSGTDDATRSLFASVAAEVTASVNGKTLVDTMASASGAVFNVRVTPGLACVGMSGVSGCTSLTIAGTGEVTGGTIEFDSASSMLTRSIVMHEVYRTLGMNRNSPASGIMALTPAPAPTAEELAMFVGRYSYPILAVYAGQ